MSAAERAHLIDERGLDRSLLDQYGIYVRNTLRGELEIELPLEPPRHGRDRRAPCRTR